MNLAGPIFILLILYLIISSVRNKQRKAQEAQKAENEKRQKLKQIKEEKEAERIEKLRIKEEMAKAELARKEKERSEKIRLKKEKEEAIKARLEKELKANGYYFEEFVKKGETVLKGPFNATEISEMLESGKIKLNTSIKKGENTKTMRPVHAFPEFTKDVGDFI